jgi:outer membrane protein OmpA-like peptidoglycan-associated protein
MACRPYSARAMTKSLALCALAAGLLAATAASAQIQMYPGEGITVNGQAASMAAYGPRGPYPGIVQLHMPTKPHKRHVVKKAAPSAADISSALMAAQPSTMPDVADSAPDKTASAPPPKPKKAKPAPAPAPEETDTGMDGGIPLSLAPEEPHPIAPAKPRNKTMKTASATPAPAPAPSATGNIVAAQQTPGVKSSLSKRGEILFPRGATDPGTATINKLHGVASELNTLLGAGAQRVQLEAYGGSPGDKSSDARRLSLKRALVIRQILIEDGVPSERIDVRAMGGIDDNGAPDRVDVFVNAG